MTAEICLSNNEQWLLAGLILTVGLVSYLFGMINRETSEDGK